MFWPRNSNNSARQLAVPFDSAAEAIRFYLLLSCGLLLALVGLPLLANMAVQNQFERFEKRTALSYARSVIGRSDRMSITIAGVFQDLETIGREEGCSLDNIALMQALVLTSPDIAIVGYEREGRLVCSSLGTQLASVPLKEVSFTGQYEVRKDVRLDFARSTSFNVLGQNGWLVFVPQLQSVDVSTPQGVGLATYSTVARQVRTSVGSIRPEWMARETSGLEVAFFDGGYVVGLVRSKTNPAGAIAAMPLRLFQPMQGRVIWIASGVALLAGLSISAWLLYLANQYCFVSCATLKRALRRQELYVVYQPIVDLKTRRWIGAEVLMRWRRANVDIPPEVFFCAVEDHNLEERFTTMLFWLIVRDARFIFSGNDEFYLSVNIAAADLRSGISWKLKRLKEDCDVPASRFKIEITERKVLNDAIDGVAIDTIHAMGMDTVVDDFGTGFSNLNYLSQFNFDYLKIDKAFVAGISSWSTTSAIALHIIALAKSLDIGLIAEGVENEQQAQALADHGIQFAQGWYFSKPVSARKLIENMVEGGVH